MSDERLLHHPRLGDAVRVDAEEPHAPCIAAFGPDPELAAYLELPQIKYKTETDAILWWQEHQAQFPNLELMAIQFLGCSATSASVERLFSQVGIAFSAKRKSVEADAFITDIMFARSNLP